MEPRPPKAHRMAWRAPPNLIFGVHKLRMVIAYRLHPIHRPTQYALVFGTCSALHRVMRTEYKSVKRGDTQAPKVSTCKLEAGRRSAECIGRTHSRRSHLAPVSPPRDFRRNQYSTLANLEGWPNIDNIQPAKSIGNLLDNNRFID